MHYPCLAIFEHCLKHAFIRELVVEIYFQHDSCNFNFQVSISNSWIQFNILS